MRERFRGFAIIAAAAVAATGFSRDWAYAQSADLVLCDRVAADPADPDKPADAKGVPDIAASDIATAIKFCKSAANSSRRAMLPAPGGPMPPTGRRRKRWWPGARRPTRARPRPWSNSACSTGTGAGVARDEAQARKLFERAAQAGNPRGVSNLAALGGGASSDPARARELLSKGAESNAEAQYQLGMMLAEGNGGAKDDTAARALFAKAAAQNHPGALERGRVRAEGRGGPKDSDAAKAYYQRAAALGDEDAKALDGSAVPNDQGQARQRGDEFVLLRRPTINP